MRLDVVVGGSGFPKLRSAVTLLRSDDMSILVDTGFVDDRSRLLASLAALGVAPEGIDVIVSTHLHYDHCGNHLVFPRARWIVGAPDYADTRGFMTAYHSDDTPGKTFTADTLRRRNEVIKPFYIRSIVREVTRNLDFYNSVHAGDGPFEPIVGGMSLTAEVEIVPTPGHTPGHLSVAVRDALVEGVRGSIDVLVAGDAIFNRSAFNAGLAEGEPQTLHLAADEIAYRRTQRALLDRYTHVIPGHDVLVDRSCAPAGVSLGRAS